MSHHTLSDEDIVKRVQGGERELFGVLVERYEAKMLRYGRKFLSGRQDIEDLVQEVFVKAYVNMKSVDTSRKFSSWLYRVAHNEFVNALKKKKREPLLFFDVDELLPHPVSSETADRRAYQHELEHTLRSCLDRLDAKYKEPIVLYYFEELSYQEISDILHVPVATVGVRLQRGREILKRSCEPITSYDKS